MPVPSKQLAGQSLVHSTERRLWALHLRARGRNYRQIGREMQIGESTAHKLVTRALAEQLEQLAETAAEVRTIELGRLDHMLQLLFAKLESPKNEHIERTVDSIVRVMERRAAYLGLDAPKDFRLGMGGGPASSETDGEWNLAALSTEELEQLEHITTKAHLPGLTKIADVPPPHEPLEDSPTWDATAEQGAPPDSTPIPSPEL